MFPEIEESTKDHSYKRDNKGTFVGTRDYISPEMVADSASGPFSDLWSLGVIVYELYSGTKPWTGKN